MSSLFVILLAFIASCSNNTDGSEESVTVTTVSSSTPTSSQAADTPPVLSYAGEDFALGSAIQVRRSNGETHSHRELHFTDGTMSSSLVDMDGVQFEVWRPSGAAIWLHVDLFAPLWANGFAGSYRSIQSDSNVEDARDVYYFRDARLGRDLNGNLEVRADEGEMQDVMFGSIDIVDESPHQRFIYTLVLNNGITISGNLVLSAR